MQTWAPKFLIAVLLMIVSYQSPVMWLSISATAWIGYAASAIASPLLIAASQDPGFARKANRALSIVANIAAGALLSAPVALLIWYRVAAKQ